MFVKNLKECEEFIAGDNSILREILHPDKSDLKIRYSLAHAKVPAGKKTKPHRLESCEVYFILKGKGLMHIDDKSQPVESMDTIYIRPHAIQHIENTAAAELEFLCIVEPAWRKQDETVFNS